MIDNMPPGLRRRDAIVRIQLNTKMETNLLRELRVYAAAAGTTLQDVLEYAVRRLMDEFPTGGEPASAAPGAGGGDDDVVLRLTPGDVERLAAGGQLLLIPPPPA